MKSHHRSTKSFWNLPCAHRQHRHPGACAHVHGYSRSFHFTFGATYLDPCRFVVDFGGQAMKAVKAWLEFNFDHTLLINDDDPLLDRFRDLDLLGAARLIITPFGAGMEGCAEWAAMVAQARLDEDPDTAGRCWVISCECRENDKNSAVFITEAEPPAIDAVDFETTVRLLGPAR